MDAALNNRECVVLNPWAAIHAAPPMPNVALHKGAADLDHSVVLTGDVVKMDRRAAANSAAIPILGPNVVEGPVAVGENAALEGVAALTVGKNAALISAAVLIKSAAIRSTDLDVAHLILSAVTKASAVPPTCAAALADVVLRQGPVAVVTSYCRSGHTQALAQRRNADRKITQNKR
jgi:hypothetical protein